MQISSQETQDLRIEQDEDRLDTKQQGLHFDCVTALRVLSFGFWLRLIERFILPLFSQKEENITLNLLLFVFINNIEPFFRPEKLYIFHSYLS